MLSKQIPERREQVGSVDARQLGLTIDCFFQALASENWNRKSNHLKFTN